MAKKEVVSITLEELTQHIASAIKENLIVHKGVVLNEGVRYDDNSDMFIFDFENDNETDLIQLKKVVMFEELVLRLKIKHQYCFLIL